MMGWMLTGILRSDNRLNPKCDAFVMGLIAHSTMIFRSIKYWKLTHLQAYLRIFIDIVEPLLIELNSLQVKDSIIPNLFCILGKVVLKCRTMGWTLFEAEHTSLCAEAIDYYKSEKENGNVRRWMRNFGTDLLCGFIECSKPQKDNAECFKLCGGCKMTYYLQQIISKAGVAET